MNDQEHGVAVLDPENKPKQSVVVPAVSPRRIQTPAALPASQSKPVDDDFDDEPGFIQRNMTLLIVGGLVLAGGAYVIPKLISNKSAPVHKEEHIAMLPLPPPPPPPPAPPPPPPPQQQKEEKMEKQTPVADEEKHDDKPAPKDEPPLPATGLVGPGGQNYLGSKGGGNGRGGNGGNGSGSKYGYYAAEVQRSISARLRENQKTKKASFQAEVRIWADSTGHVTQVKVAGSSPLTSDVLDGMQLASPPPPGMKMPIVLRITERRPGA